MQPRPGLHVQNRVGVLTTGLIVGMISAALAISFAALIFTGLMTPYLPIGAGMALAGAALTGLVVAFAGGLPGTTTGAQDNSAVILALAVAGATASVAATQRLPTAIAVIVTGTVLTGVAMLAIGRFRLGRFVRYVPYPVIGGFLAGTGWLLVKGGSNLLGWSNELISLRSPNLLFGVILALGLLTLTRFVRRPLAVPGLIVAWVVGFHLVRMISGMSLETAARESWVIGGDEVAVEWSPAIVSEIAHADWTAVLAQATTIGTAVVLAIVALLLYVSALEVVADRSIDMDRELGVAGLANLAGATAGGLIAYHYVSLTTASLRMSAPSRVVTVVASLAQTLVLLGGVAVLRWVPTSLAGGLLLFLGLDLLIFWVFESRATLPVADWVLVLVILSTVALFGFLPGVGLGVLLAVLVFIVSYGRQGAVRHELTGASYRSKVDRSAKEESLLDATGDGILIFDLQGYLFFGSAADLVERVQQRIRAPNSTPLQFLIMDFKRVTGIDSSAVQAFQRIDRLARIEGFALVWSAVNERTRRQLGTLASVDALMRSSRDDAMELCENLFLSRAGLDQDPLQADDDDEVNLVSLAGGLCDERKVARGEMLINQGQPSREVIVV
ncbi:MAG: SulP family inorganic anion transporter, partial [Acidimicrobiia bacterium]